MSNTEDGTWIMKMIIAVVEKFQYFNLVPGGWVGVDGLVGTRNERKER